MHGAELTPYSSPSIGWSRWLGALLAIGALLLFFSTAPSPPRVGSSLLLVLVGVGLALASPWAQRAPAVPAAGSPEDQAERDGATRLLSRPGFEKRLALALAETSTRNGSDTLVIVDVRNFHHINAALGHRHGDDLLQQLAHRFERDLPPSTLLARLSGDVFGVLLRDVPATEALATAQRLTALVAPPFSLEGVPIEIEASYGVAAYPEHGSSSALLLEHAESALRLAKEEGEPCRLYVPSDPSADARRLQMFGALRLAIEREELAVSYQPKLAFETNSIVGCEALLSWTHPQLGRVSPSEFIAIAEQTSLIKPLTRWVLERAIRQLALWKRAGLHLRVAVNLSARNLSDATLPAQITKLLETWGVGAENLMVEITESAVLLDPERAGEVLERLASLGIALSLDDFGTGYSSLNYLRMVPAGELKLDRSFVRDIDVSSYNASIVRGITQLAHDLDMRVVAEGVETEGEARRVRELGCDLIQGYLISRPLPADDFESFVRSQRDNSKLPITLPRAGVEPSILHVSTHPRANQPLRDSLRLLRSSLRSPPASQRS